MEDGDRAAISGSPDLSCLGLARSSKAGKLMPEDYGDCTRYFCLRPPNTFLSIR